MPERKSITDKFWWKMVVGISSALLALTALFIISVLIHESAYAESPDRKTLSSGSVSLLRTQEITHTDCSQYLHSRECDNDSLCLWNIQDYECVYQYEFLPQDDTTQCSQQFHRIESVSDCILAATHTFYKNNMGLENPEPLVVNDPGHPQGCYFYDGKWLYNEAKFVQPTPTISGYRFTCKSIPSHCWNGVLDCENKEFGVDCGDICKKTCANVDDLCPPEESSKRCTRYVYASNNKWSAMFLYLWTTFIPSINTKRQTLNCENEEYIYKSNYGRCTLDDEGKLRISVKAFESTHTLCNIDGFPASHDSPSYSLEDGTYVRGTCSTLYFIHPMTVVSKQERRNTYNMPWEWNDPFARERAERKSDEYWRSQLICSPFHEDSKKAVYEERCCFDPQPFR